jgi:type I restriction enzyme S subunit
MALTKYYIGDLVEPYNQKCGTPNLMPEDVSGISIDKEFFEPAKQVGEDTSSYKVVPPNYFACNLMHVGRDEVLPIALNHSDHNKIVSPAYSVFKIKNEDVVLKEYFFILLKSTEKDRYFWFHTDSSIRQGLPWEDFCDIDITLPSIEEQRKYVDIYLSLQNNLASYQSKVDELKLVCDGFIEALRRDYVKDHPDKMVKIGDYISKRVEVNDDGHIQLEQGINIQKQFITPQRSNSNLYGRRIVRKGDIAYCTQLNNDNVAVAYREGDDCVVSSVYDIIFVNDTSLLLPKYLMLWLIRPEFGRYVYTRSTGSAYEFLSFDDLADYKIPLPDLSIQQAIVNIYDCANERKTISDKLKEEIKEICPILIKGSLQTNN